MNKKLVTSRELSQRLKEAGVKQESEFYWALFSVGWGLIAKVNPNKNDAKEIYSAYLSGELGELLPIGAYDYIQSKAAQKYGKWIAKYFDIKYMYRILAETEAEVRGLMLEHLIKNKLMGVRG